ncbi:uncharacterized protein LOC107981423 [Nasonia vitripennis]|uniref:Integrase core domain-containing protein n=1 Tax=Nasonia vitripennis TaxID=7425 RepID=A0A7M7IU20_NASVI|nr:uncharacterized protein LOC107981423 [Nasonia vitripennis]
MESREECINYYFQRGYTYKEIVGLLRNHNINITVRHLQRILRNLGLRRKGIIGSDLEEVCSAIISELDSSGSDLGYKTLWRRLKLFYNLVVKRDTILDILRIVDPDGLAERLRHRLRRRKYNVPGPNFIWHIDGYDKLKPFGFAIHGGIDGFSRKILWLEVASSNNNPDIISYYYLKTVQKFDLLPTLVRSDKGTENCIVESLQQALRYDHEDSLSGADSFIKGRSTSNQRIEAYWSQMRREGVNFWINFFKDLRDTNLLNDSDVIEIEFLRYCFGPLLKYDLEVIRKEWNSHKIRRQRCQETVSGKPNCLFYNPENYDATDYKKEADQDHIKICLEQFSIEPKLFDSYAVDLVQLLKPGCNHTNYHRRGFKSLHRAERA